MSDNLPATGAVQDAIYELDGTYARMRREADEKDPNRSDPTLFRGLDMEGRARAATAVAQMLALYHSDEWDEVMARRPSNVSDDLFEKWGVEDEVRRLRAALADAHRRIGELRAERDGGLIADAAGTDNALAGALRFLAEQAARHEKDAHRFLRERFEADRELRRAREDLHGLRSRPETP